MTNTISQASLRKIFPMGPKRFTKSRIAEHYFYSEREKHELLKTQPRLRSYVGKVAKTDYPKTCVVQVQYSEMNAEVRKVYQHSHMIYVHDPEQAMYIGDEVLIGPRVTQPGVAFHGKPYQVIKLLKASEGYTDHTAGKVWLREKRPSSYLLNTTRVMPRYMEDVLPASNLKFVKGTRSVLESIAKGKQQ